MKPTAKRRFSKLLWMTILIFMGIVLTFPKWITVFYPLPHREIVFAMADEYHVDPYLVFAIIRAESKYQDAAKSRVGARGLMQIMPETGQWIADQMKIKDFKTDDLHDPEINIRFGCWYLNYLQTEFKNSTPLTVAAYNAGGGKVEQWLQDGQWDGDPRHMEKIPFPETQLYVKNVLHNYEAYQAIY